MFADVGPGAMREELERLVVGRARLPESWSPACWRRAARRTARAPRGLRPASPLDARERTERAFLDLCVALPDAGRAALAELDLDSVFTGELTRRAATHLREHIDAPGAGLEDDGRRARGAAGRAGGAGGRGPAQPAQLEVERLQLELALPRPRDPGRPGLRRGGQSELAARRREVKAAVERALTLALEQTAGAARVGGGAPDPLGGRRCTGRVGARGEVG